MERPTINTAVDRVRTDPDARFATILAAVFAFSAGFVFGFLMGQLGDDESEGIELAASADVAA
jgi:enoyl-CoA hydratase/carnithine racemase